MGLQYLLQEYIKRIKANNAINQEYQWFLSTEVAENIESIVAKYVPFELEDQENLLMNYRGTQYIRFYYDKRKHSNWFIQLRLSNHSPNNKKYEEESRQRSHYYINSWDSRTNVLSHLYNYIEYSIIYLRSCHKIENKENLTDQERNVFDTVKMDKSLNDKKMTYDNHAGVNNTVTTNVRNNKDTRKFLKIPRNKKWTQLTTI